MAWRDTRPPRAAAVLGMALTLVFLGVMFAAGLVGYVIIRTTGQLRPPPGTITLPPALWLSTVCIVAASVAGHLAVRYVEQEKQRRFRYALLWMYALAGLFVIIQGPSLFHLLERHETLRDQHTAIYGLIFCLVLLHALHVIGGMAWLTFVLYHALRNRYDHESYTPIRFAAWYWHFLDIVWLVMFVTMLVTA